MTGKKVNVTVQGIRKIMRKEPINILFIIHNLGKYTVACKMCHACPALV